MSFVVQEDLDQKDIDILLILKRHLYKESSFPFYKHQIFHVTNRLIFLILYA